MKTWMDFYREIVQRDNYRCHICNSKENVLPCYAEYDPSRRDYALRIIFEVSGVVLSRYATHGMCLCHYCRYDAREDIDVMLRQFSRPSFGGGEVTMIVDGFQI